MSGYTDKFLDRRSGRERRDWDEFVVNNRRKGHDRRSGTDRRKRQVAFPAPEKRRLKRQQKKSYNPVFDANFTKQFYVLPEVAQIVEVSPSDILEWIRSKWINESDIGRDHFGRLAFTRSNIEKIKALKNYIKRDTI